MTTANQAWAPLLARPDVRKFILTSDGDGLPHLEENATIHLDADGRLVLLSREEHSPTQHNLVRGIWFKRKVAIHLRDGDGSEVRIVGRPYKAVITGPRFEEHYRRQRDKGEPLSTVWLIDPEAEAVPAPEHLPLIHLDRIVRD